MPATVDQSNFLKALANIRNDQGLPLAHLVTTYEKCREHIATALPQFWAPVIESSIFAMVLYDKRNEFPAVEPTPEKVLPKQDASGSWTSRSHTSDDDVARKSEDAKAAVALMRRNDAQRKFNAEKEPTIFYTNGKIDYVSTEHARQKWNEERTERKARVLPELENEAVIVFTTGPNQRINHAATERARAEAKAKNQSRGA